MCYSMIQCVLNWRTGKLYNKSEQILKPLQNIHFRLTLEHILELFWQNILHLGHFSCDSVHCLCFISLDSVLCKKP